MAATVQWNGLGSQLVFRQVDVTFDNSYPTGGYAVSTAQLGLGKVLGVIVMSHPAGYVVEHNVATGKLVVYRVNTTGAVLGEVPAATNLSGITAHLLAVGSL